MPAIVIYTAPLCPYCHEARGLLKAKGAPFTEVDLSREPGRRKEMVARAGGRTSVPQVFIGERHVGGCDDLFALDAAGGLDPLLAA